MWSVSGCTECTCSTTGSVCKPAQCNDLNCASNERQVLYRPESSCCGYCEPVTCLYNNNAYQVGDMVRDSNNPCLSHKCTATSGMVPEYDDCPFQAPCPENLRIYDQNRCCYTCNNTCALQTKNCTFKVSYNNQPFTGTCEVQICVGTCYGNGWTINSSAGLLQGNCCKPKNITLATCTLTNTNNTKVTRPYPYNIATSCACQTA
ncbi:integumentary mucin B.1-like [Rhinatrema bivittatum]|uniref:integumentary mucin B.1-like n=1 Tax=Rhinatrema bivittatum TaxID=194408 RepID=UPI00112B9429|nr:integumentary mucin B.1-like [Rhinatrema bivittatum]